MLVGLVGFAVVAQVWNSTLSPLGVVAGLGAAVAFAFYFLAGERGVAHTHPLALRHTSATAVGIAASAEMLFAFAVAWVWLGETLTALQIVGSIVVLAGIALAQTARQSPTAALEPPLVGEDATQV